MRSIISWPDRFAGDEAAKYASLALDRSLLPLPPPIACQQHSVAPSAFNFVVVLLAHENSVTPLPNARYGQAQLQQCLQVAGCKPRAARKVAERAFRILQQRLMLPPEQRYCLAHRLQPGRRGVGSSGSSSSNSGGGGGVDGPPPPPMQQQQQQQQAPQPALAAGSLGSRSQQPVELGLLREEFEHLVADCLAAVDAAAHLGLASAAGSRGLPLHGVAPEARPQSTAATDAAAAAACAAAAAGHGDAGATPGSSATAQAPPPPPLLPDFRSACSLREHTSSVTILLCGTSGTGKSTLASLLASRLGITTVVSTDRWAKGGWAGGREGFMAREGGRGARTRL